LIPRAHQLVLSAHGYIDSPSRPAQQVMIQTNICTIVKMRKFQGEFSMYVLVSDSVRLSYHLGVRESGVGRVREERAGAAALQGHGGT
jgi:hypothetical protein